MTIRGGAAVAVRYSSVRSDGASSSGKYTYHAQREAREMVPFRPKSTHTPDRMQMTHEIGKRPSSACSACGAQRSSMRVVEPRHQSITVHWLEAAGKLLIDPSFAIAAS